LIRLAPLAITIAALGCSSERTWEGRISDDVCKGLHDWDEHGARTTEQECALSCIKAGAKYVFLTDGEMFSLQGTPGLDVAPYVVRPVRVTGRPNGKMITASKIEFP
jgi:hypothetical protein